LNIYYLLLTIDVEILHPSSEAQDEERERIGELAD
jgi:hypothetical protein